MFLSGVQFRSHLDSRSKHLGMTELGGLKRRGNLYLTMSLSSGSFNSGTQLRRLSAGEDAFVMFHNLQPDVTFTEFVNIQAAFHATHTLLPPATFLRPRSVDRLTIVILWYKRLAYHRSASSVQRLSPLYQSTCDLAQHPSCKSHDSPAIPVLQRRNLLLQFHPQVRGKLRTGRSLGVLACIESISLCRDEYEG